MRRWLVATIGIGLLLALGGLRLADPTPVQAVRDGCFDQRQRIHPRAHVLDLPVPFADIRHFTPPTERMPARRRSRWARGRGRSAWATWDRGTGSISR
jgi:hypothetical protein